MATPIQLVDQDVLTRMGAIYLNPFEPDKVALDQTLVALSALELPITPETLRDDELADLVQFAPVLVVLDPSLANLPGPKYREAPWYTTKTQPSVADMLAKLRRVLIAIRFRLPHPTQPTPAEIRHPPGLETQKRRVTTKVESLRTGSQGLPSPTPHRCSGPAR
jgi:hypothetical protein